MTIDTRLRRCEGRLFTESGVLFLVVATDEEQGTARVSCRVADGLQVIDMPLTDVTRRLTANADLKLDNLNGPNAVKRIVSQDGEWFFTAREGLQGPFATSEDAKRALARYILCMQDALERPPVRNRAAAPDETSETADAPAPTRGEPRRNPDPAGSRAGARLRASDRNAPRRAARAPAAG